jgi:LPS export ABC transporter protein LptC
MKTRLSVIGLALAIGVAAACSGKATVPTVATTRNLLADSADQVMFHIRTVLTDRGMLKADLRADTAFFFNDNTKIELRGVMTTFFTNTGQKNAVLTSREGTYDTRLHQTEARKNVVVVSEDGRRLTTSQLRFQEQRNEISSDSAFVLTETGRRVEGIGFVSDPNLKNVRVRKLISGSATQGGGFVLPGQ